MSPWTKMKSTKKPSKFDSALAGAANGATAGMAHKMAGGAGFIAGKLGLVPDMGYEYYRDGSLHNDMSAMSENPKTAAGAALLGAGATTSLPSLLILRRLMGK